MNFSDAIVTLAPFIAAILVAAAILVVDFIAPGPQGPGARRRRSSASRSSRLLAVAHRPGRRLDRLQRRLRRRPADHVPRPAVRLDRRRSRSRSRPTTSRSAACRWRSSPRSSCSRCRARCCIAGSADLLVLFLGLELMVLPGYVLAGYHKTDGFSTEGAIKYFLLGSFSQRDLPVRPRVRLGPHRHDPDRRRGRSP